MAKKEQIDLRLELKNLNEHNSLLKELNLYRYS